MKKLLVALAAVALMLSALSASSTASANPTNVAIQICFAIDGSGSIDTDEFTLEKAGFAAAIEDASILPQDGSVEVTVKVFASSAATVVAPTVIDSQATADAVADDVRNTDRSGLGNLTDIEEGVNLCVTNITGSPNFAVAGTQAINIATNGAPTTGETDPVTVRDNAVAAGIDRLDAEAVQPGANTDYLLDLVYPQPGELVTPPTVPTGATGFVLEVESFDEFADAIAIKVPAVIEPRTGGPPVVGGIAGFMDDSGSPGQASGSSTSSDYTLPIGVAVAGALVALAASGWYVRRRWLS